MNAVALQHSLPELLTIAGAMLVGRNRANCPRCGGKRTVSYTEEVFCCHHAGCDFRGNPFTLAKWLGLTSQVSPARAREIRERREKARRAARWTFELARARRFELYEKHQSLMNILGSASERIGANTGDEVAWAALRFAYRQLDRTRAESLLLENGRGLEILAFYGSTPRDQAKRLEPMIRASGMVDRNGRFALVDAYLPGVAL